jgi:hypothetical protein
MPGDNQVVGAGNMALSFNQLADVVALLMQWAALWAGNSSPPPSYTSAGGNAANLATVQSLVAGGALSLAQPVNAPALRLTGTSVGGGLQNVVTVLDPYGSIGFGVGFIGTYSNGNGFYAYDRAGNPCIALNPLGGGLSFAGCGINNYQPAQSSLSGSAPPSGNVLNWAGTQDDWAGADMDFYVPVTFSPTGGAAASVQVTIGAVVVLASPLVQGQSYSQLSVLGLPGALPNTQNMTLVGNNGANLQTVTTSSSVAQDAAIVPVTGFTANANYSAYAPTGAAPTSYLTVGSFAYPWYQNLFTDSVPAGAATGSVRTIRFKVPNKWTFSVNLTNATAGNLQALSC